MNFAGFGGGFSNGFANGVNIGNAITSAEKQKQLDDLRAQGIAEAKAARQAAIDAQITSPQQGGSNSQQPASTQQPATQGSAPQQGIPTPATGGMSNSSAPAAPQSSASSGAVPAAPTNATGGLPFVVNGKGYATHDEAVAAADKQTPGLDTFLPKAIVPKMTQFYIEQGDPAKADAWQKWAEDKQNHDAMNEWAQAYRATQAGDFETAANHVFNLYKQYDDGITPLSKETVKDKDGNVTGFNVRLKNDKTGEVTSQFIDKKNLTELGLTALSPPQMFELQFQRQAAADAAAAKNATEIAKENRDFAHQVQLKGVDQNNAIEKLTIEKQLDAANASAKVKSEVGAKVSALRDAGYSDDFINQALPAILGVGDYKKTTSPEEARRLAFSDRMKNDPMFSRKPVPEQQKIIDQDMGIIYAGGKPTATPPAGGLPAAPKPAAPAQQKGIPVYDTKTGQIVYK